MTLQSPIAPVAAPPRALGAAWLSVAPGAPGPARLVDLRLAGSLKILFPRGADHRQAVLLNTAGGLTGGDRMDLSLALMPGADLTVTTQAAERVYRSAGGHAQVTTAVTLGAGARLNWLPQETILYDGAALRRRLTVDMDPGAHLLLVEPMILGRAAMGETVRRADVLDRWDIRRQGVPLRSDALRLSGDVAAHMARAGAGAGALASVLLVAPGAADRLDALRTRLPASAAASAPLPDALTIRMLAPDGFVLRRDLIPLVEWLAARPMPKVWRL